jgi:AAA domain
LTFAIYCRWLRVARVARCPGAAISHVPIIQIPMNAPRIPDTLWFDELARTAAMPLQWIWHGYIASGAVTLLTSRWKAGKTTLLSVLLNRMGAGGELAGSAVAPGRAVVVSEEAPQLWARRGERLGFGAQLGFVCRPFLGKPSAEQWLDLVDRLGDIHRSHGLSLAVIDPLANVLPGADENGAAAMIAALAPLQRLTVAGVAVLILHHPRKQSRAAVQEPRGSGALPGFVDFLIDLDGPRAVGDRRRRLRAVSRYDETPGERLIELSADGTDYAVVTDPGGEEFLAGWSVLRLVLEEANSKMTRRSVMSLWPPDFPKPSDPTLYRWLERAVELRYVSREGTGRRNEPFVYWMPEREEHFNEEILRPLPELDPVRLPTYGRRGRK